MINATCSKCGGELYVPGGIVLSPPFPDGTVQKHHICVNCYPQVTYLLMTLGGIQ